MRWSGNFDFAAGDTTFTVTADDGVRLYLDGALVIDKWIDQSATTYTATRTMTAGTHQVKVEYYENDGDAVAKASWSGSGTNTPPTPVIDTPAASLTWKVGDQIPFTGHATDPQQGTLPASALSWRLLMQHCPSNCHTHVIQSWPGVASGSFSAPDHEYPSYLELELTATDAGGLSATTKVRLDPKTVVLSFSSSPSGLQLSVNASSSATPFTRTVIVGSTNSVSATSPQTLGGTTYSFTSWSDGGAQSHNVVAPAGPTTYTATYSSSPPAGCPLGQYQATYFTNMTLSGSPALTRCETTINNDWGTGAPAPGIPADLFSVRWSGNFDFAAGDTTFTVTADDGVRLYLDGALVIDKWIDQSATTYTATRTMTAGTHQVKVEYYENDGDAVAKASWSGGPPPAGCPLGQYQATYFTNMTLSGSPALTRCETTINNDWGTGAPAPGIPADLFSVRWSGNFDFAAGDTTFTVTADDGVRLYLDGALVIDKWIDQSATTYTATRTMTAGTHQVKVEYYENDGDAVAKASWSGGPPPAGCPLGQYQATYFTNMTLSGSPALTRCETTINNDWGTGAPAPGIPADLFSVRWSGNFNFAAGDTTFTVTADDGVRLYLDGALVIDKWIDQSATTYTATRTMTAGTHQVKVEYYENAVDAVAKASWTP